MDNFYDSQLERIYEQESASLEAQWRTIHFRTMMILSLFIVAAEIGLSFVMRRNGLVTSAPFRYYVRYLAFPAGTYVCIDVATLVLFSRSDIKGKTMDYIISLAFAAMCLAVCFYHDVFSVVYAAGVTAIALTTIYGDQKLTGITTLAIIAGDILLALFGRWDGGVVRDETYMINVSIAVIVELSAYLICIMVVQWEDKRRRAVVLRQMELENLRRTAEHDQLTGVKNRLGLRRHIDEHGGRLAFAMLDIDFFKKVNDTWGHEAGDVVLKGLGRILLLSEDENTAAFRYGGDEFLLAFTDCTEKKMNAACERICRRFSDFLPREMRDVGVGLSYGVSPGGRDMTPSRVISMADEALYRRKNARRV